MCGHPHHGPGPGGYPYYWQPPSCGCVGGYFVAYPFVYGVHSAGCCDELDEGVGTVPYVRELMANPSSGSAEALVGGEEAVLLTLEYTPSGDGSEVKVEIVGPDGTTTAWQESSIPAGFHVKQDFPLVERGSKLCIKTAAAIGRLRWCEFVLADIDI